MELDSERDTKIFEEVVNPTHDISLSDWIIGKQCFLCFMSVGGPGEFCLVLRRGGIHSLF